MSVSSKRRIAAIVALLTILLLGSAVYYRGEGKNGKEAAKSVTVRRGDLVVKIAETGSLEPSTVVEIKSEQSGEIKKLFVRTGDQVQSGGLLAVIQQESNLARQVAQFRAGVEQERLNLEEARRDVARMEELVAKGFVAQKEVEVAEKELENAKIRHELAKRQLLLILGGNRTLYDRVLARAWNSEELDEVMIFSPIAGTVLEVKVAEGEIVSSGTATVGGGTTLMLIADLSKMLVKTKINEVNIDRVAVGQPAWLHLDALPGSRYRGSVARIAPKGEKENNIVNYEVILSLENTDHRLMPGMTADVDIIVAEEKDVLLLPLGAVRGDPDEPSVQIPRDDGDVPRRVRLGLRNESEVEVLEGLREGDQVLLPRL